MIISGDNALKILAKKQDLWEDLADFLSGKPSKFQKTTGFRLAGDPMDSETAVFGGALAAIASETGHEIEISVNDMCFFRAMALIQYSCRKFCRMGLIETTSDKDDYGFPMWSVSAEQIEMLQRMVKNE